MVFNSLTFLTFFAVALILHNTPLAWRFKKLNLVIASCIFYAAWNPPFVLLLMFSAVSDFWLARWMQQTTRPIARRLILITSLSLSLGLLCLFKYSTFLLQTLPLGGSQVSEGRVHVNLMTTMLLGGLWHGPSWHYVAWGGLHGGYLVAERKLTAWFGAGIFEAGRFIQFGLALLTFGLVCLAWTFFRAANLHDALSMLRVMANPHFHGELVSSVDVFRVAGVIVLMLLVQWMLRDRPLEAVANRLPSGVLGLAMGLMIVCLVLAPGSNRAFIYFQF